MLSKEVTFISKSSVGMNVLLWVFREKNHVSRIGNYAPLEKILDPNGLYLSSLLSSFHALKCRCKIRMVFSIKFSFFCTHGHWCVTKKEVDKYTAA